MTEVEDINNWLNGTPYLVDESPSGQAWAKEILNQQVALKEETRLAQEKLVLAAVELRRELEQDFDARLVFESNAIEGVGTTFDETKTFLSNVDFATVTFGQGLTADPKMLEVVGHGKALRFIRDLANSLTDRPLAEVDIRNIR